MKKKLLSLLCLLALWQQPHLFAETVSTPVQATAKTVDVASSEKASLAIKYAVFLPSASKVRDIYGSALPEFILEGNYKVIEKGSWDGDVWLEGSYIFSGGHSLGYSKDKTRVNIVPFSMGIKYVYHFCPRSDIYLGIGPSYSFMTVHDSCSYVRQKTSAGTLGAVIKSGFTYALPSHLYFDGSLNYRYQKFSIHSHDSNPTTETSRANFSGFEIGLGIGWKF